MNIIVTTKEELVTIIEETVGNLFSNQQKDLEASPKKVEKDIVRMKEAIEITNLSKDTIYRLTSAKGIPHFKKRRRLYFSRSDLMEWISEGRQDTIEEEKAKTKKFLAKNRKK